MLGVLHVHSPSVELDRCHALGSWLGVLGVLQFGPLAMVYSYMLGVLQVHSPSVKLDMCHALGCWLGVLGVVELGH